MSWYDESDLFDSNAWGQAQDGNDDKDPNIVDWQSPDDPENPMNWSATWKWANVITLSCITMISTLASSMFAPGIPQVMAEFESTNSLLSSFVVSVFILGYVFGPVLIAPCTELYGRLYVYHISHVLFTIFTVACAYSPSLTVLILFRFLSGIAGSTPITIGSSSVADTFTPLERGRAMSVWSMGPLIGPVIGPIAGGFLTAAKGWRSVFWTLTIAMASSTLASFFVFRETYAPILLARKATRARVSTSNPLLKSKYELASNVPRSTVLTRAIVRPIKMLLLSPIVLALSAYMALVYGYLYILFTTLTGVFEQTYHFPTSVVGLTYLGLGIGMVGGIAAYGFLSDKLTLSAASRTGGAVKPEHRLPPILPGAACIPIGLLIYGWTAEKAVFWLVPILSTIFIGLGLILTFMPIMMYLVEAFTIYAASATAANTIFRSLGGTFLPLAGKPLYDALGQGRGNTLLAGLALIGLPTSWGIIQYGESIRLKWPVKL
ncbi:MAG: hypothetical protein Q9182_007555 [Xanthomendoza sp. 2 TL-2023]